MENKAFQDYYSDQWSHCYGCGRLNGKGLQIKSYWRGEKAVCEFSPEQSHIAIPGYVYGRLIASLIDCHSTGTAAAGAYRKEGRPMDSEPPLRFVAASLKVDYLKPTPLNQPLTLRSKIKDIKGRKVAVTTALYVKDELCARGEVVAVQIGEDWVSKK